MMVYCVIEDHAQRGSGRLMLVSVQRGHGRGNGSPRPAGVTHAQRLLQQWGMPRWPRTTPPHPIFIHPDWASSMWRDESIAPPAGSPEGIGHQAR